MCKLVDKQHILLVVEASFYVGISIFALNVMLWQQSGSASVACSRTLLPFSSPLSGWNVESRNVSPPFFPCQACAGSGGVVCVRSLLFIIIIFIFCAVVCVFWVFECLHGMYDAEDDGMGIRSRRCLG